MQSSLMEAFEHYETLVDDHEVAADEVDTTDNREVRLIVVPHVHSLDRRPVSSE